MDTNTLVAIGVLAIVVIVALAFFPKVRASISQSGASIDASNDPVPGAKVANSKTTEGGALADDKTGRGALIDNVQAKGDLIASSTPPPASDPKAQPPSKRGTR